MIAHADTRGLKSYLSAFYLILMQNEHKILKEGYEGATEV